MNLLLSLKRSLTRNKIEKDTEETSFIKQQKKKIKKYCSNGNIDELIKVIDGSSDMSGIKKDIDSDDYESYLKICFNHKQLITLICLLNYNFHPVKQEFIFEMVKFACKIANCELFDALIIHMKLTDYNSFAIMAFADGKTDFGTHIVRSYPNMVNTDYIIKMIPMIC